MKKLLFISCALITMMCVFVSCGVEGIEDNDLSETIIGNWRQVEIGFADSGFWKEDTDAWRYGFTKRGKAYISTLSTGKVEYTYQLRGNIITLYVKDELFFTLSVSSFSFNNIEARLTANGIDDGLDVRWVRVN